METKKQILLVEDDANFGMVLKDYLQIHDFNVELATNGEEGLEMYETFKPDLCVLDVMMPKKDGFSLARDLHQRNGNLPIIFLTAKTMKEDILKGFQLGADDYLTKPFDSEVLLYKIRAIINRTGTIEEPERYFTIGNFRYDAELRKLQFGNKKEVSLTPKEGALLHCLAENKGELVQRDHLLRSVWREDSYFAGRSMDVYLAKLRKYLKADPKVAIVNVHSAGYRLVEDM